MSYAKFVLSYFYVTEMNRSQHRPVSANNGAVTGRSLVPVAGDVLLGTVTVPLLQVITQSTG
jgi:hypothetical protein